MTNIDHCWFNKSLNVRLCCIFYSQQPTSTLPPARADAETSAPRLSSCSSHITCHTLSLFAWAEFSWVVCLAPSHGCMWPSARNVTCVKLIFMSIEDACIIHQWRAGELFPVFKHGPRLEASLQVNDDTCEWFVLILLVYAPHGAQHIVGVTGCQSATPDYSHCITQMSKNTIFPPIGLIY